MANLKNGTLNYFLTKDLDALENRENALKEMNKMDPTYPDPNDPRFTDPAPVFTIQDNQLYRDGVAIGTLYNNKTGKIVEIDTITENSFSYIDTDEDAIISQSVAVTTVSKLTGLKEINSLPDTRIIAIFDIPQDDYWTNIYYTTENLSKVEIDGVVQPSITKGSKHFDTKGKHIVKYTLTDPTYIPSYLFEYCDRVTRIILPDSITQISGYSCFSGASNLVQLNIPANVTTMNSGNFSGCTNLRVTVYSSSIGDYWFSSSPIKEIIITDNVKSIGKSSMSYCQNLTSVNIPSCTIDDYAFQGCRGLVSVTMSNEITSLGKHIFDNCINLESCNISTKLLEVPEGTFYYCRNLSSIVIPNNIERIGQIAFYYCDKLNSITFSKNLVYIDYQAFYDCYNLTSVILPDSVRYIESQAFGYCQRLKTVSIPKEILYIENNAFSNTPWWNQYYRNPDNHYNDIIYIHNVALQTYYFSTGNTLNFKEETCGISGNFISAYSITSELVIPDNVLVIGYGAFKESGFSSITIGSKVMEIRQNAFSKCYVTANNFINKSELDEVENNYWGAIIVDSDVDGYCTIGNQLARYKGSSSYPVIPNTITSIGDEAFRNSRVNQVTIPNSVISIGEKAFYHCPFLSSLNIPNSVTSIGKSVAGSCENLLSVIIGNGITVISESAFNGDYRLYNITMPNTVTTIGKSAFHDCSMSSITLSNALTTIGEEAFEYCQNLTKITIPSGVTSIGNNAFYYCGKLANITSLATTAPTIQNNTFYSVKTDGTLTVPAGATGYDTWMGTGNYYLGKYNWAKVEQS